MTASSVHGPSKRGPASKGWTSGHVEAIMEHGVGSGTCCLRDEQGGWSSELFESVSEGSER